MDEILRKTRIDEFINKWRNRGREEQDTQIFWFELLQNVLGVENPSDYIEFEYIINSQIQNEHFKRADAYLPGTKVIIEQKSHKINLDQRTLQSDGSKLTPVEQAYRYGRDLSGKQRPKYILVSNFSEFRIYDFENISEPLKSIRLKDLKRDYKDLFFLIDEDEGRDFKEQQISIRAGDVVAKLYHLLKKQYGSPTKEDVEKLNSLNMLCVRIVFCLYCEDAGVFKNDLFLDYLSRYKDDPYEVSGQLERLFEVLDTPVNKRRDNLPFLLSQFPYVDGNLFKEHIEIPPFNSEIVEVLLEEASHGFNWSDISPAIFGAVFEQTLNPDERRQSGMHYTSVKNIKKVIDPLFLDDLKEELNQIINHNYDLNTWQGRRAREKRLLDFIDKIASLKFLDPACGSGNFLTQTYIELRRLENLALNYAYGNQQRLDVFNKISLEQFYGIEINSFAVAVAQTALWIAEEQMNKETEEVLGHQIDFLPLKTYPNIIQANALRIDWNDLIPASELSYIMGNPPFVGYHYRSKEQKNDMDLIFTNVKKYGKLDYVSAWFKVTSEYIRETSIEAAFVSTNTIVQGWSVGVLWKYLFDIGLKINFAYLSFIWANETPHSASVHCVIIGFSMLDLQKIKRIIPEGVKAENGKIVAHINGYLLDAPEIAIEPRREPIQNVNIMRRGGKPTEGGNLIFDEETKNELLQNEPQSKKFIRPFMMGRDFLNKKPRYCLWLVRAKPDELKKCSNILKRIDKVRQFRLASKAQSTREKAKTPTLFGQIYECSSTYLALPEVSSENRQYIPIDFLPQDVIAGNHLIIMENADLYYFGILTSNVHNAWMRTVAGRLKSDYSYSNTIVYNNFVWPNPTDKQKTLIEKTAQNILDVRAKYPDSSLADLYDELTMPPDLRKAHLANDIAVMDAYGFDRDFSEEEIVAELMKKYQKLAGI